ncbi:MAG TPA: bifunctional phosphoribosylaminoimidazolecarboxamide formyltransferase/IMP cyclohydrolase, partial [Bdellovibrionales bacterium]|nr:bifunctional phosphoribosylaminoimidazolecarboxamide formyltransferase/IMP cyclohydrolase [Bdellovibrionales bacterium]
MAKFKNALVSVSDKTGLVDFLKPLAAQGLRVVSTGGTAQVLRDAGMAVIDVSEQTGFPEVMEGRVKTLHPRVHMALLARGSDAGDQRLLQENGLESFDLVIVNLYPFEQTLATKAAQSELIENIDIGGPSLLRAASKNFERITVVVDPGDYARLALLEKTSCEDRQRLAAKAFAHVSSYDAMISHTLAPGETFGQFGLGGTLLQTLRYGENPHQKAFWYKRRGAQTGWHESRVLQGKELSYNNLLDLESALGLLREFDQPSAVAVKHCNPCGAASADRLHGAVDKCLGSDPVSVFGGIVAVNQEVGAEAAESLGRIFLECIVAPKFSAAALEVFAKKKNLRLLEWPELGIRDDFWKVQSVQGGFLVQEADRVHLWSPEWRILGETPSPEIRADLSFAWATVAHLKSNAIAIASGKQSLGLGMGQVNRVDSVDLAIARMRKFHPEARTPVLASDAFFPFSDSVERLHEAGIRWVIQPGGSVRDDEVFAKA